MIYCKIQQVSVLELNKNFDYCYNVEHTKNILIIDWQFLFLNNYNNSILVIKYQIQGIEKKEEVMRVAEFNQVCK